MERSLGRRRGARLLLVLLALMLSATALAPARSGAAIVGTTYYVSPTGDNNASGTSESEAWQSVQRVSAATLLPGDRVLLEGGATFSGLLWLQPDDAGSASNPVVIGSYGIGRPTIAAGIDAGVFIDNTSGVIVSGIDVVGDGPTVNTNSGIYARNSLTDKMLPMMHIIDVNVSGFGKWGVVISGENLRSGFTNIRIERVVAHENAIGGVIVWAAAPNVHRQVVVESSKSYSNRGVAGIDTNSGNGIVFGSVNGGVIQNSVAYENGGLNDAPDGGAGIWAYRSTGVTIQFNESYNNRTGGRADGGGFDLDENVTNSRVQYNYSHGNDGSGYLLAHRFNNTKHHTNVIRYNVSENDGRKNGTSAIAIWGSVRNADIYGNTVHITAPPSGVAKAISLANTRTTYAYDVHVWNNIFSVDGVRFLEATPNAVAAAVDFTLQGNDYFTTGRFNMRWNGTTYTTMAAWQSASGQEQLNGASTAVTLDPQFTSPGNGGTVDGSGLPVTSMNAYALRDTSPLIDRGLDLLNLFGTATGGRDFYGNPVPRGSGFDIGAHEAR